MPDPAVALRHYEVKLAETIRQHEQLTRQLERNQRDLAFYEDAIATIRRGGTVL